MSTSKIVKTKLKKMLQTTWIGRPIRKATWLLLRLSMKQTRVAESIFRKLPYVMLTSLKESETSDQILRYYRTLRMDVRSLPTQPLVSVLVPVYNCPIEYLEDCLNSVIHQLYTNWELCIVDDCSTNPEVIRVLKDFAKKDSRIKVHFHTENQHISATSNACLKLASGDFITLLDHDDRLYPSALAEIVRHINLNPNVEILYSDEQVIDKNGEATVAPLFKPGWSPQLHLRVNYTTHLSTYKTELISSIGGFRKGFEGSQDHELMLRAVRASESKVVHIPLVLYQWRAHEGSTAGTLAAKPYAAQAGEKAVRDHLAEIGRNAEVAWDSKTSHLRIKYELVNPTALVSIILCSKDSFDLVNSCIQSIRTKSTYSNFEIVLIDHQSRDPACLSYFEELQADPELRFKWVRFDEDFNFAKMNNLGARHAQGDFLVLLNNDTEVIEPDWLQELMQLAQFSEIGAVGPKLLYPDNKIQHAGVNLADRSVAMHMFAGMDPDQVTYIHSLNTVRETAAVTGACLCIRKLLYEEIGGLLESYVANGFGDVELCLRLMQHGYQNIFTPHSILYHHESPTRKLTLETFERQYMIQRYGHILMNDPYFNSNLERLNRYQPRHDSLIFQLTNTQFQHYFENPIE